MIAAIRAWESRHRNHLCLVLFVVALCSFLLYNAILTTSHRQSIGYGTTDLAVFYVAGAAMVGTNDLEPSQVYEREIMKDAVKKVRPEKGGTLFLYPPQAVLLFTPFGLASIKVVSSIWLFVSCLFFIGSYYLAIRYLIGDVFLLRYRYSLLLLALTWAGPVNGSMLSGNVNSLIWLLLIGGIALMFQKRPWLAGIAFGIATCIKVFPILFLPYLVVKKQWKAVIAFVATGAVATLASLPWFSLHSYEQYVTKTLLPYANGSIGYVYRSVSLYGSFRQVVQENVFTNLDISKSLLIKVVDPYFMGLEVVIAMLVAWLLWRRRMLHRGPDLLIDYTLLMSFFLVFSRNIHSRYAIWLLPFVVWLVLNNWRRGSRWLTGVGIVLLALTQYTWLLPEAAQFWWVFYPQTLGFLGIFVMSVVACRRTFWEKHVAGLPQSG